MLITLPSSKKGPSDRQIKYNCLSGRKGANSNEEMALSLTCHRDTNKWSDRMGTWDRASGSGHRPEHYRDRGACCPVELTDQFSFKQPMVMVNGFVTVTKRGGGTPLKFSRDGKDGSGLVTTANNQTFTLSGIPPLERGRLMMLPLIGLCSILNRPTNLMKRKPGPLL